MPTDLFVTYLLTKEIVLFCLFFSRLPAIKQLWAHFLSEGYGDNEILMMEAHG